MCRAATLSTQYGMTGYRNVAVTCRTRQGDATDVVDLVELGTDLKSRCAKINWRGAAEVAKDRLRKLTLSGKKP
jgi:hypothetical protein